MLDVAAIEKAITPFLGPDKSMADVEGARAALEKVYQDAGYLTVFVDVPEQRVNEGVVQLHVLEGRVERLSVTGARYFSQGFIRERVPELADGKVPNFNVVQAQLAEVNRTDDRRVQPVLRPGRTPGTVETELQVNDRAPVGATVELNNRHAQFTEPLRLQVSGHYNNLFQRDHAFSITAITSPQDTSQSKVLALSYSIPEPHGDAWLGYAVFSDSSIEPLGSVNVIGKGFTLGVRHVWNLPSLTTYAHSTSMGFDYKNLKEDTLAGNDQVATPLKYLPFNLSYNGQIAHSERSQTQFSLGATFNFRPILQKNVDCAGTGEVDQFACKREGADAGFSTVKYDVTHQSPVFEKWQAQLHLGGQLSSGPVVGAEQYALGGAESVRGYLEAEGVGDHGVMGSLELRSPNWGGGPKDSWMSSVDELTGYGFVDIGEVRTIDPGAGQLAHQSLAGAGVGLKLRAYKQLSSTLDWAWPLLDAPATRAGHPRLHVRVSADF